MFHISPFSEHDSNEKVSANIILLSHTKMMKTGKAPDFGAFKGRPGVGTRFLVRRNVEAMVNSAVTDASSFTINSEFRYIFLLQLYSTVLASEDAIAPFTDKIVKVLYKSVSDDDKKIQEISLRIAYAIGFYVPPAVFIPVFMADVTAKAEGQESLHFSHSAIQILSVMREEIRGTDKDELAPHLKTLVAFFRSPDLTPDVADSVLGLIGGTVDSAEEWCKEYRKDLFHAVLSASALAGCKVLKEYPTEVLQNLARNCGIQGGVHDLFAIELGDALKEYQTDYKSWTKTTPQRFAFEILLHNAKEAVLLG